MTKQVNFSVSKNLNSAFGDDGKKKPRKPPVYSNEDLQHIVQDSKRARLINFLIQPDETREFCSYIHTQDNMNPTVLTSHRVSNSQFEFLPKQVISTYPLESGLRFSPYSATVGIDSQEHIDLKPYCRCETFNVSDCTCKEYATSRFSRSQTNILAYCDRQTNTPRLKHACCGSYAPVPEYSNKVASTQDYRDVYNCSIYPTQPILKKPFSFEKYNCLHRNQNFYEPQKAVRDTDMNEEYEPTLRSCFKRTSDGIFDSSLLYDRDLTKRTLYNEGISDYIAHRYPKASSPKNVPRERKTRTSNLNIMPDNWIPFSYKIGSKYHNNCKENNTNYFNVKMKSSKLKYWDPEESISTTIPRLPRKVLSSMSNIEQFVTKKKSKILISTQKCGVDKKKKNYLF